MSLLRLRGVVTSGVLGLAVSALFIETVHAQLFYAAGAQFADRTGIGLFQEQNGQVTQIPTGFVEHNFPSISRDNNFIVFSSPDPVTPGLQVPPSSDIYIYSRASGQTRRVVDHTTSVASPSEVDSYTPVSAVLSPDDQVIAYGVTLTRREGLANPQSTKELNIARASDGLILANPTFGRGPVSDAFQAEFVGISWDPTGNSFVTPSYFSVPTQNGSVQQLPGIVRYTRNQSDGSWFISSTLSQPRYFDAQFPIGAETQIYPTISPSGTGLAYFDLSWPDVFGNSQGVVARIVVANSDGSNPVFFSPFPQGPQSGFYPVGIAWDPTGTSLIFSIAPQINVGTGYLALADATAAVVRRVNLTTGEITQINGVDAGFFPSISQQGNFGSPAGAKLGIVSQGNGQFVLKATGVDPNLLYRLQSSTTPDSSGFGTPQNFLGSQLLAGINAAPGTQTRFFRLIQ